MAKAKRTSPRHDLVACFANALGSTAPVLRQVLPENTRELLLCAPAG
ncbi:hypothetical protein [Streptomyces sp. NPDC088246]